MEKQLGVLKGEIDVLKGEVDALTKQIGEERLKWEKEAIPERAVVILEFIERLESRLDARSATRDALLLAAAAADARGKYPPLAVDDIVPLLYANTQRPPLVVASLSSETPLFKPSFKSRFKPCVELEAACSYGACPPVVRGVLCFVLVWRVCCAVCGRRPPRCAFV